MAPSDYINYAVRPNKTVERKLIFEILSVLSPLYNFAGYRYIGFGALWFVDFVMAHKYLSIGDMISIERHPYLASRAEFNKPYSCVTVKHGESDGVLPKLKLEEVPLLVWLDYEGSLDGPVLRDLSTLCQRALSGSVLIVTINANKNSLPDEDEEGRKFGSDEERLRYFADDLIPQTLPKGVMQASKYPAYVASLIFHHMRRQVRTAGRESDQVVPLFNVSYSDGAPMITVGAAIVDARRAEETSRHLDDAGSAAFSMDESNQLVIGVPPLTLKEKACLDQLMPCHPVPTEEEVVAHLGFKLRAAQITAYHRFYRYYPMFGEVAI